MCEGKERSDKLNFLKEAICCRFAPAFAQVFAPPPITPLKKISFVSFLMAK